MAFFVGSWIEGDDGKYLRLTVRQNNQPWGTVMGTGWTCALEVRRAGSSALLATVTGAWEDATEAACVFGIGAAGVFDPAGDRSDYEAVLLLTKNGVPVRLGANDDREPFGFSVTRWP